MTVQNNQGHQAEIDGFGIDEARSLKRLLTRFMKEYGKKPAEQSDQEWLKARFLAEMPEMSEEEAEALSRETVKTIYQYDENLKSLKSARKKGQTSEEWFAEKTQESSAGLSAAAFAQRLSDMDTVLDQANTQMIRTVKTLDGEIKQQWNLDGFIAEQHHAKSSNIAAQARGTPFSARVCAPEAGQVYGKNSFDLVICDQTGKTMHQYQCKYGADAKATIQLLKRGNYNNQTILVPPEQVEQVQAAFPGKTVVSSIGGTERVPVSSEPLTKAQAKELQIRTQESGIVPEVGWGSYDSRILAKFVGKQAALAGISGAAIGAGFHMAAKLAADEPIEPEEVVKTALETGADAGVKTVTAGAIKVAAEKGMIGLIPPGTPVTAIANIACVAVENIKILAKVAKGELTVLEGLDQMGCNTVSMTYGLGWGVAGATAGAAALNWVPIVGPVVGGLAGGTIGYLAGSKFGQTVYEGAKKAVQTATTVASKIYNGVKETGKKIARGIGSVLGGLRRTIFG